MGRQEQAPPPPYSGSSLASPDPNIATSSTNGESQMLMKWNSHDDNNPPPADIKGGALNRSTTSDQLLEYGNAAPLPAGSALPTYRVYKRRFFGLIQLILLNIVISWDWLTYASISTTAAQFFNTTPAVINWLSTAVLFAFAVTALPCIYVLNHYGPKASILVASALVLVGNWVRYAGTRAGNGYFGVVMFGQILIGFAQPFVLAAPTRYAQLWFSDQGRITAIAITSLANPFGGALGQLISPLWADTVSGVPNMILYVAIISSAVTVPAPFIPTRPPTLPSATASLEKIDLARAARLLPRNASFWLLFIVVSVYVGCFNATSSLINQIFGPYGLSETDSGIAGGLLILVGLVSSAVVSPIVDRTKAYLLVAKLFVPPMAALYVVLIWMPNTRGLAGPFVVMSLIGACAFSVLPLALELLTIMTLPVSPEVSSVIVWTGGQILGGIFIIVMSSLQGGLPGQPADTLERGLIFQAVFACAAVPLTLLLGTFGFRKLVWNPEGYYETTATS